MRDTDLTSWSRDASHFANETIGPGDRLWRKLFMGKCLGLKLFVGASMVGADFAFLLCILRLLTDAHLQQVDVTGRNALVRYPNQLAGKSIPVIARVFSIADVFDALTSRRPYKPPFPLDETLRLMAEGSGQAFDPEYLTVFLSLAPAFTELTPPHPKNFY